MLAVKDVCHLECHLHQLYQGEWALWIVHWQGPACTRKVGAQWRLDMREEFTFAQQADPPDFVFGETGIRSGVLL